MENFPDVFILCGGQGTRFREVREDIPKVLAPINGVPFIDLLFNELVDQKCGRIILGTGYLSDQIETHIQHRQDAEYFISRENQPLGTGGAIRHALPLFQSEQILVMNGDSYIAFCIETLLNFHQAQQAEATILLSAKMEGKDYGNVELGLNHTILSFQEKPKETGTFLINSGVYCLQKKLIKKQVEATASLERDWFPQWLKCNRVVGLVLEDYFYDIGTKERFELAEKKFEQRRC